MMAFAGLPIINDGYKKKVSERFVPKAFINSASGSV